MANLLYLREGMFFGIAFFIMCVLVNVLGINQARKKLPKIRSIAAYEAIDEAVSRCAEMGRPLHFTKGVGPINEVWSSPEAVAGYSILTTIAKKAVEKGVRIISSLCVPHEVPLTDEILSEAYMRAQRLEEYDSSYSVRYLGFQYWTSVTVNKFLYDEEVASNMMIGSIWSPTALIAGEGKMAGCLQISGLTEMEYLPFYVACSDYTLIGEELFVAGAISSKGHTALGCVTGTDWGKVAVIILCFIGAILSLVGSDWLVNLTMI